LEILEEVFKRIRKANLKLGPDKCKFGFEEIKYAGDRCWLTLSNAKILNML
jgi:hypothetical protein